MASVLWVFYASKVPEFFDTVLMALKQNFRQITFLHVYHHSSIFVIWWFIISYVPSVESRKQKERKNGEKVRGGRNSAKDCGSRLCHFFSFLFLFSLFSGGSSYFSAALNSFVHVIMYGYYLWASLARKLPEGVRPTWTHPGFYRKYITKFQLFQFCCNFVQASYMLFVSPPADFALFTVWILFFYMISMLALFGNFYLQAYMAPKSKVDDVANKKHSKKAQ